MNTQKSEIKNLWRIIATGPNSILELRAIWPDGITPIQYAITKCFHAVEYESLDACKKAFEVEALALNDQGYNIYIVMNPISSSFKGRSASDADISHRDLILIDIDRSQKVKAPATDDDVEAANQLAEDIMGYLEHLEWPDPIRVMSGNGHHLYYVLPEFENDEESKKFVQSFLKGLADKFDNDIVKVDTSVFNASRITKVVGTIARKGIESEGRPYRMACML
jgi:hypothetical protein